MRISARAIAKPTRHAVLAASRALVGLLTVVGLGLAGTVRAASREPLPPYPLKPRLAAKIGKKWGIEIVALRPTAAGRMIDFRYRILDPGKAAALTARSARPYLIDHDTGWKLAVPVSSKLGPLRQTVKYGEPPADRVFFILFPNPDRSIRSGDEVTVVIGDFKLKHVSVQ
jgi:hypothetical protein